MTIYLDDPTRYIGGTVVHHRKLKPHPADYYSTDEETLRDLLAPLVAEDQAVLDPATAARIRSKLAIQREMAIIPVGPDAAADAAMDESWLETQ